MKVLSTLLTTTLLATQAFAQGTIVSYSHIRNYTIPEVEAILTDFGAPVYLIPPQFEVAAYKVVYETTNAQGTGTTTASGAVAFPIGVTCPMPLLSYQHGTTSERYDVPSYSSSELKLGVIFSAADGHVVTLPDYLGLGDSPGFHPYVHAATEASAALDLLRAARTLQDSLGYVLNGQLFMFGYSQGGHATMALFREIETNHSGEFTVTGAAPMSGPYDISGAQAKTITDSVAYSSPGYLPYVVMGYQEAYGNLYNSLSDVFKAPYDTMLDTLFDGTHGFGSINNLMPDTPNHMIQPAVFQDFLNNPANPMRLALADNDVYSWVPQAPLQMYYCTDDEQVFYQNALVAFDTMIAKGASDVEAINIGHFTHSGCLQGCMVGGRGFFNGLADTKGGMQITTSVTDASTYTTTDGAISLNISGGQPPYNIIWNTGDTITQLTGLDFGIYTAWISDARGCFHTENIMVDALSGIEQVNPEAARLFTLAPNPASQVVQIIFTDAVTQEASLSIRDVLGRMVHFMPSVSGNAIQLDIQALPAGMYSVDLQQNGQSFTQKLIVR